MMNDTAALLILGAGSLFLFSRPRTLPVAQTVRNQSTRLEQQAARVRNTAISVAGSINDAGAAIGSIAESSARIVDSIATALNVGAASLPEYGGSTTRAPLLSGTDPYMAATGYEWSGGTTIVDEGGENALDPTFFYQGNA